MAGAKGSGGKRKGAGRKKGDPTNTGRRGKSPKDLMNAMIVAGPRVDHGKDVPPGVEAEPIDADFTAQKMHYIDPVQFCQAVINGDTFVLQQCGVLEIPDLDQKLEASRISVQYTNKKKPVETLSKHEHSWVTGITEAEQRVSNLRMDVEVEDHEDTTTTVN